MKHGDRYFIGPGLRVKLREVINRHDGEVGGPGPMRIPTRLQDMLRRGGGNAFRVCTFTGTWSIGATKTLTYKYITTTPNTVVATNLFANIPVDCGTRDCGIARDGTAWFLIAAKCS